MKPMTLRLTELDDQAATFTGTFVHGNRNTRHYRVAVSVDNWIEQGRPTQVSVTLDWPIPMA